MKVWVALGLFDHEPSHLIGVFLSEEKADEYLRWNIRKLGYDDYEVLEIIINE